MSLTADYPPVVEPQIPEEAAPAASLPETAGEQAPPAPRWLIHHQNSSRVYFTVQVPRLTRDGFRIYEDKGFALSFEPLNSTDGMEGFPAIAEGSACELTPRFCDEHGVSFDTMVKMVLKHKAYGINFSFWDDEEGRKRIVNRMIARARTERKVFEEALEEALPRSDLVLPEQRVL